ncbi:Transposase Tc1-like [Trinorchestia longiramus]|nr:Transposase Tc1-like [Trinorchestia longiramus]
MPPVQCVAFVQRFHADREAKLRANLTNERWRPVPAPADLHQLANTIHTCDRLIAPTDPNKDLTDHKKDSPDPDLKSCSAHSSGDDTSVQKESFKIPKYSSSSSQLLGKSRNDNPNVNTSESMSKMTKLSEAESMTKLTKAESMTKLSKAESMTKLSKAESMTKLNNASSNSSLRGACDESFSLSDDHQDSNGSSVASRTHSRTPSNTQDSRCGGVVLCGEEYVVVSVGVVVVRLMVEYVECATTLNMAAQSLLSNLADLLRRFNSETCSHCRPRLLLEAGAVSAGSLRTINARHLALAHRCLHLVLTLLPYLLHHFLLLVKTPTVEKTISQVLLPYGYCSRTVALVLLPKHYCSASVGTIIRKWKCRNTTLSKPRTARPQKINDRAARKLVRTVVQRPQTTRDELKDDLKAFGIEASKHTMSRTLRREGLRSCTPRRTLLLQKRHVKARLKYANDHLNKPAAF